MDESVRIVTVTLNPAVDRVLEAPGFTVGRHVRAKRVALFPAGKGVNVSRTLAALGRRSVATGFVGVNELRMFEEHLERAGKNIAVSQFLVVRARTRDNITIIDPVNETESHLLDVGFTVQPDDVQRISSKLAMLARESVYMVFGGSMPPGVSAEALLAMVRRSSEKGARVVTDVSGEGLKALRGERVWMGKFNKEELAEAVEQSVETEAEFRAAARALLVDQGGWMEVALVSRGPEGAVVVTSDGGFIGRVGVHPGRILTTVGSGDALLAGALDAYTRTGDWRESLRQGLAVATANAVVEEAGAIRKDDIDEFFQMAMVEPLAD